MSLNNNNRIFWAIKAFGIAEDGSSSFTPVKGLQSVGITTTFNLEQVFQIGQSAIYENVEDTPDVEVTLEKVLDGYPLIYHLATPNATAPSLIGRSNEKCTAAMSIFGDDLDSASGTPNAQVTMSGMFVSSISYAVANDGNATESVTLVGNNKVWATGSFTFTGSIFDNTDVPLSISSGTGGVQRRENFVYGSATDGTNSLLPAGFGGIPGINPNGTNSLRSNGRGYTTHVNRITVSADLGREALNELGLRNPFFRFVNLPVEVSSEIEILAVDADLVSATEEGVAGNGDNLFNQRILIVMDDSTKIDTGDKNKLQSVSYGGADAGGGNATCTFSYVTYNSLTVQQGQDPAGL